jgi:DNA modification methylase
VSKIAIAEIVIPGDRQRKDLGDIDELANSLARFNLLHPIVLDQDNILIAGRRRLAAAMHLGWQEIEFTRREDLDELSRKELELEENIKRKALNWPEEVKAVQHLFKLRQQKYGDEFTRPRRGSIVDQATEEGGYYSQDDLGEELDKSKGSINFILALADAIDENPEIMREPTRKAAWTKYLNWKSTKVREELAKKQTERLRQGGDTSTEEENVAKADHRNDVGTVRQPIRKAGWRGKGLLYHADARDVLKLLPTDSVDAIVCDPPFGLGMHKEGDTTGGKRLAAAQGHMYDDDPHTVMDMIDEVFMLSARVLKDDGFVYCFFHMTRYENLYLTLRKHFGKCNPVPIVWIKNTPGIGDPNRDWVYAYEPCFFVSRGDRRLVKAQAYNYLKYDTIPHSQKIHPTQKPAALLRHLISASCVRGETVLDPFAGSGSTLVGAHQVGCRFIGIEREEAFYRKACENIAEALAEGETPIADQNPNEAAQELVNEEAKDGAQGMPVLHDGVQQKL